MNAESPSRKKLTIAVFARLLSAIPALWLLFFWPAGTLAYWEAWVYMAILLIPIMLVAIYLLNNDPALLERRMQMREQQTQQRWIIALISIFFLLTFLLPGFDKRYGWSDVPVWTVLIADAIVLLGYGLFFLVLRQNSYAARTVEVEQGQEVISTGPYALVRHPMYSGVLLMYSFSPLALGSTWAMLPMILLPCFLAARILNEEKVLREELEGYEEYTQKVKYRLIPGLW
ncbi:MAG: isoprenylcysteine carboxylmethyltransferase family protein [Anaerolineales bacterium]